MAPSRPTLHPDQIGLLIFTLLAVGGGVYLVVRVAFG